MILTPALQPLMGLRGVSKRYVQPSGQEISILENIHLNLREGEIVALLGPSGSGKSTLMRMIAGVIPPSKGQVIYRNQPMLGLNPGVVIVFQSAALDPWLTVLENVELGLKAKGIAPDIRRQKAIAITAAIGLDRFKQTYPQELSGGMRQRVGFARALAVEPELLCMDEPFSALDQLTAENLRTDLINLWLEKRIPTKAILIATHQVEEAVTLADRLIVLGRNPGRIRAELRVTLPHYRDRKSLEFQALVDKVYQVMTNSDLEMGIVQPDAAPIKAALMPKYQTLPPVRAGAIAGLLELLEHRQDKDLDQIGQDLQLKVGDLLLILEAATILGLIEMEEGQLHLNSIANEFIQAGVDERKQIFRSLLLANVQLVQQINRLLRASSTHRVSKDLLLDILTHHFSPDEAQRQLDTVISWGRYAEIFSYDELTGELTDCQTKLTPEMTGSQRSWPK